MPDAQAFAFVQQHDLIGKFRGQAEFVRHDDDGVAILCGQAAELREELDLRADVQMQRGLVEQQHERLLGQRASQHHALLFAAGDFVHPAVGQMLGADLREGVLGDGEIVLAFKP